MKSLLLILILAIPGVIYSQYPVELSQFELGEKLNYRIKYGWFKIGEAKIGIDEELYEFDGVPHYRIYFELVTVGWLKIFADLDLDFESFINKNNLEVHHAKRITINGKKSNSQFDEFEYTSDSIYVNTYKKEKDQYINTSYSRSGIYFTDALGTYFYARSKKLEKEEKTRLYIASRIYDFEMQNISTDRKTGNIYYQLIFPPIKEFPRSKTSYTILKPNKNVPTEIKLSTNNGNFFLILEE